MSILTVLGDEAKALVTPFLTAFIQDDVGKLAVAAVQFAEDEAETILASTGEAPADEAKRESAKTNLLNAAEVTGKNLVAEGTAVLNALIENALQAVAAGLVSAAVASL